MQPALQTTGPQCRIQARHAPMAKELKEWYGMYEASYCEFVTNLLSNKPPDEKLVDSLIRFRVFKGIFYSRLLRHGQKSGAVTSLDDPEGFVNLTIMSRMKLLETFPEHAGSLQPVLDNPVAFLPFIRFSEDPTSEILGQTMKFDNKPPMIIIRSGTGRELATTMHEHLHAAVKGLPGAFEEGFCRYSLQAAGHESDEVPHILEYDEAAIRMSFAPIFYPNLLVNVLAQGFGEREVRKAFFKMDTSDIDGDLRVFLGKELAHFDAPFRSGSAADAIGFLDQLVSVLGSDLAGPLRETIGQLGELLRRKH
ncbi:MAG: hypothetical protein AB1529_04920 [Candidatus Micrarchaeota archaeon]